MKHNESQLQKQCVKWFRYQYPHLRLNLFSIPNGGKRSVVTASIMKAEGAVAGVADLMLAVPRHEFHGLFIEMKHGKNGLSEPQREFKAHVEKHGYRFTVCSSFDQFEREVEGYLGRVQEWIAPSSMRRTHPAVYQIEKTECK